METFKSFEEANKFIWNNLEADEYDQAYMALAEKSAYKASDGTLLLIDEQGLLN